MPERIQRKRTKGWRKADYCPDAVFVGRPSKWGNPYVVKKCVYKGKKTFKVQKGDIVIVINIYRASAFRVAVEFFRRDLMSRCFTKNPHHVRAELKGKDLMCWCPLGQPCHADVLLEIANS